MLNPRPGPDLHLTLCWSSSSCVPPHSVRCPRAKGCTHPNPGQSLVAKLSPWDPGTFSDPTVLNLLWGPVRPLPLVVHWGRIPLSKGWWWVAGRVGLQGSLISRHRCPHTWRKSAKCYTELSSSGRRMKVGRARAMFLCETPRRL